MTIKKAKIKWKRTKEDNKLYPKKKITKNNSFKYNSQKNKIGMARQKPRRTPKANPQSAAKITPNVGNEVIAELCGNDVLPLIAKLKNTKNFSEFKLAEVLNQDINHTRNQIYRLLKYNLVSFVRRKDKRKGWYIYYWTFRLKQVKYLVQRHKEERLKRLQDWLKREEEGQFFGCKSKCMRISFDAAVDLQYKCPECGGLLELEDNSQQLAKIKESIKEVEDFLKNVEK